MWGILWNFLIFFLVFLAIYSVCQEVSYLHSYMYMLYKRIVHVEHVLDEDMDDEKERNRVVEVLNFNTNDLISTKSTESTKPCINVHPIDLKPDIQTIQPTPETLYTKTLFKPEIVDKDALVKEFKADTVQLSTIEQVSELPDEEYEQFLM